MYHASHTLLQVPQISQVSIFASNAEVMEFVPQNCTFVQRDVSLDSDETLGHQIYRAFAEQCPADIYVLAHATSPFLQASTVERMIQEVESGNFDSSATVELLQTYCWFGGRPLNFTSDHRGRTQDLEPIVRETSGCYVFSRGDALQGKRLGIRPYLHQCQLPESIDIDEAREWTLSEMFADRL